MIVVVAVWAFERRSSRKRMLIAHGCFGTLRVRNKKDYKVLTRICG